MWILHEIGSCAKKNHGSSVRFIPDESYFDDPDFDLKALKHLLKAKAVLCSGLVVNYVNKQDEDDSEHWCFTGTLSDYLKAHSQNRVIEPNPPFYDNVCDEEYEVAFAVTWEMEGRGDKALGESFCKLNSLQLWAAPMSTASDQVFYMPYVSFASCTICCRAI